MIRSMVFAGAIALTFAPPVAALSDPTPATVPPHRANSAPRTDDRRAEPGASRAPVIDLNARSTEPNWETLYPSYRLRESQPTQNYVLYQPSPWNQPGCFANNLFPTASSQSSVPGSTDIGSLVDDRSKNLFSSKPSYNQGLGYSANAPAPSNTTTGLQYEFGASQCTPFNSFNF